MVFRGLTILFLINAILCEDYAHPKPDEYGNHYAGIKASGKEVEDNVCYLKESNIIYVHSCSSTQYCKVEGNKGTCETYVEPIEPGGTCKLNSDCYGYSDEAATCNSSKKCEITKPYKFKEFPFLYSNFKKCGDKIFFNENYDTCIDANNLDDIYKDYCIYPTSESSSIIAMPFAKFKFCGETKSCFDTKLSDIGSLENGVMTQSRITCKSGFAIDLTGTYMECHIFEKEPRVSGDNIYYTINGEENWLDKEDYMYWDTLSGEEKPLGMTYLKAFKNYMIALDKKRNNCDGSTFSAKEFPITCRIQELEEAYFYVNHPEFFDNPEANAIEVRNYLLNQKYHKSFVGWYTIYDESGYLDTEDKSYVKTAEEKEKELRNKYSTAFELQNYYRSLHGSPDLVLNEDLNAIAQGYAEQLANSPNNYEHSGNTLNGKTIGENLSFDYKILGQECSEENKKIAVQLWYSEIEDYDFADPKFSSGTAHFTQLIWKETTNVGFGMATRGFECIVVANYYPPGNSGDYKYSVPSLLQEETAEYKDSNFYQGFLYQNEIRAKFGAEPLELDEELNKIAANYSSYLAKNSPSLTFSNNVYKGEVLGECIYYVYTFLSSVTEDQISLLAFNEWYTRAIKAGFNFSNPDLTDSNQRFFSQMIWKGSKKIGLGVVKTSGYVFFVANYYPAGNKEGEFKENLMSAEEYEKIKENLKIQEAEEFLEGRSKEQKATEETSSSSTKTNSEQTKQTEVEATTAASSNDEIRIKNSNLLLLYVLLLL